MKPIRLLLLCFCLCPLAVYAQTAEVGGAVQDPSGAVIPKASVEFRNQDTGVRRQATTNGDGVYHIGGIDPGKYDATVQAKGFKTLTRENVVFQVGDKAQIDFKMQVGDAGQTVTVDGSGLQINTTDASVSTVVDRSFVENLPLNGRSFQDLISLTPGVVTQSPQTSGQAAGDSGDFSVNGQRTESNYYMVDGVSANISAGDGFGVGRAASTGSISATTALGTTQSLISVDAMQEFRVQSSTYSAEYGRTPGGQFSLLTRSGTNSFHGTVYDYLRNDVFDANDWFNDYYGDPKPALRQNDFGGTLGGPLRFRKVNGGANKSFFFGSYEGLRLTQPEAASLQFVPDTTLRSSAPAVLQPILNAFPLPTPNGVDYGNGLAQFLQSYSLPSRIDSTSVRVDHTVGEKLSLFFRYGYTPSSTDSRELSALSQQHIDANTYTLGATSQFSSTIANEFRLGYARTQSTQSGLLDSFGGATPINLATAMGLGGYSNANPYFDLYFYGVGNIDLQIPNSISKGRQWNANDSVSIEAGRHQLKAGVDYRRIDSPLTPASPFAYGEFDTSGAILANSTDYAYISKSIGSTPVFNEFAAFIQDEWRAASRLTLSLGLRWEIDPPPGEAHGNDAFTLLGNIDNPAALTLAPQGTSLWKTTWLNFAPRLGAAWTADTRPGWETVIRAGGGVFFDTDNELATQGFSGVGFNTTNYLSSVPLPFVPSQLAFSTAAVAPYTGSTVVAFPSHLQLPYTLEWNTSLQQALGSKQAFTISYLGANGRRLIQQQLLLLGGINPNFDAIYYVASGVTSNYQALQLQFQRNVTRGVHALASYTWSHSIDFGSTGAELPVIRGNSDFDLRNNLQAGATWDLPSLTGTKAAGMFLDNWSLDARLIARSGFPVTLYGNYIVNATTGQNYYSGVDIVPGQPIYLYGSYPGGRAINPNAFTLPTGNESGDAPRNFVRGFGASQLNVAAHRDFPIRGNISLQFRAETFNLLNHPDFGYIDPYFFDTTFGQATQTLSHSLGTMSSLYQQGGARSMQLALKVVF